MERSAFQNSARTIRNIANIHLDATGRRLSIQTVRNELHKGHLRSSVRAVSLWITPEQRKARLNLARNHMDWTIFLQMSQDIDLATMIHVYEHGGVEVSDTCSQTAHFKGGPIMLWGGIY